MEQSVLDQITDRMATVYNYDTGPYAGFLHETNSNKALLKVDWNVSSNHNLMFRYNRLDAERDLPPHPFVLSIFDSGRGPEQHESPVPELGLPDQQRAQLVRVRVERAGQRGQVGQPLLRELQPVPRFPERVQRAVPDHSRSPRTAVTYTTVGHEPFSIENNLDTDVLQLTNDFTLFTGRHSLTFGANYENFKFFNSFNLFRYGTFGFPGGAGNFTSLDDFFTRTNPGRSEFL